MIPWKPKSGPVLRQSRLWHLAFALAVAAGAAHLGGYGGLGWSGMVLPVAFGWELGTPLWDKVLKGPHPFGDVIDLVSFVVGWLAGAVGALVIGL